MTQRALPPCLVLLLLTVTSSATAQTAVIPASHPADTSTLYSISIEELEMIMPDRRLMPEEDPSIERVVEAPHSAIAVRKSATAEAAFTVDDLRALEDIDPVNKQLPEPAAQSADDSAMQPVSDQVEEAPSR